MKQINENEIIFEDGEDVILSPENEWIEITTFKDAYENIKRFVRGFENES